MQVNEVPGGSVFVLTMAGIWVNHEPLEGARNCRLAACYPSLGDKPRARSEATKRSCRAKLLIYFTGTQYCYVDFSSLLFGIAFLSFPILLFLIVYGLLGKTYNDKEKKPTVTLKNRRTQDNRYILFTLFCLSLIILGFVFQIFELTFAGIFIWVLLIYEMKDIVEWRKQSKEIIFSNRFKLITRVIFLFVFIFMVGAGILTIYRLDTESFKLIFEPSLVNIFKWVVILCIGFWSFKKYFRDEDFTVLG
jgi:hypothetical protein